MFRFGCSDLAGEQAYLELVGFALLHHEGLCLRLCLCVDVDALARLGSIVLDIHILLRLEAVCESQGHHDAARVDQILDILCLARLNYLGSNHNKKSGVCEIGSVMPGRKVEVGSGDWKCKGRATLTFLVPSTLIERHSASDTPKNFLRDARCSTLPHPLIALFRCSMSMIVPCTYLSTEINAKLTASHEDVPARRCQTWQEKGAAPVYSSFRECTFTRKYERDCKTT
jgi:hypothetical protein